MHRADREFSEIVSHLYEAANDWSLWPAAADSLRIALHADLIFLQYRPRVTEMIVVSTNIPNNVVEAAGAWAKNDPFFAAGLRRPHGCGYIDYELVPRSKLVRLPFYHECMRELLRSRHFMGSQSGAPLGAIGLFRGTDVRAFRVADRERLTAITPHYGRALALHSALVEHRVDAALGFGGLNALPTAVFIVTREGRVRFANLAAEVLLARNDGLSIAHKFGTRTLDARSTESAAQMRRALSADPSSNTHVFGYVKITRLPGKAPYLMFVSALPPGLREGWLGHDPLFLMMVGDPDATPPPLLQAVQALFDLTPAEARLAVALANGTSLNEFAAAQQIAITTARTQMRCVLQKMGCKRQVDVVRMLLTLPAIAWRLSEPGCTSLLSTSPLH